MDGQFYSGVARHIVQQSGYPHQPATKDPHGQFDLLLQCISVLNSQASLAMVLSLITTSSSAQMKSKHHLSKWLSQNRAKTDQNSHFSILSDPKTLQLLQEVNSSLVQNNDTIFYAHQGRRCKHVIPEHVAFQHPQCTTMYRHICS